MRSPSSSCIRQQALQSAFRADDTMIGIVPTFSLEEKIPLLTCSAIGPFQAGIQTQVPLWMAVTLHQRSLCTVATPSWLTVDGLTAILQHERQQAGLIDDTSRLPTHYYETGTRLLALTNTAVENTNAVALLLEDLLELRVDKLRQQFLVLLQESTDKNLLVSVNGIGSQELAILQSFVQQALNDREWLLVGDNEVEEGGGEKRSSGGAPAAAATDDNPTDQTSQATRPAALRSRLPIRRFRS